MHICIYCGSSTGFRKEFVELAEEFGEMIEHASHSGFIKPENMSIFNVAEN